MVDLAGAVNSTAGAVRRAAELAVAPSERIRATPATQLFGDVFGAQARAGAALEIHHSFEPGAEAAGQLALLDGVQREAIRRVSEQASRSAAADYAAVLQRAQRLGYSEPQLQRALSYVGNEAEIRIYLDPFERTPTGTTRLQGLAADGSYRNQFETGFGGGTSQPYQGGARDNWERVLFNGAYHEGTFIPSQRPKYAVLMAEGDEIGRLGRYFGGSYLLVDPALRPRMTISSLPTGRERDFARITTPDYPARALRPEFMGDDRFRMILDFANGRTSGTSELQGHLEAQLHGPLALNRDFSAFVVSDQLRNSQGTALRRFSEQYDLPLLWTSGGRRTAD